MTELYLPQVAFISYTLQTPEITSKANSTVKSVLESSFSAINQQTTNSGRGQSASIPSKFRMIPRGSKLLPLQQQQRLDRWMFSKFAISSPAAAARTQPGRVAILLRESGEAKKKKWHPAKKSINQNPQRVELFIHNVLKRFIAIMIKYIESNPSVASHI